MINNYKPNEQKKQTKKLDFAHQKPGAKGCKVKSQSLPKNG
jgi:hypothetical protein